MNDKQKGRMTLNALRHLSAGNKIRVFFSTGEIVEPYAGDAGLAAAVNVLLGEDNDLITNIELVCEPASNPAANEYIILHYPTCDDENHYYKIEASSDDEADAYARSITTDGPAGGEYDLFRRVY